MIIVNVWNARITRWLHVLYLGIVSDVANSIIGMRDGLGMNNENGVLILETRG